MKETTGVAKTVVSVPTYLQDLNSSPVTFLAPYTGLASVSLLFFSNTTRPFLPEGLHNKLIYREKVKNKLVRALEEINLKLILNVMQQDYRTDNII